MIGGKESLNYKYITEEAPSKKIDYSYSQYNGLEFIQAWNHSREEVLEAIPKKSLRELLIEQAPINWDNEFIESNILFNNWISETIEVERPFNRSILLLVKRFEVTRKIYLEYSQEMRPQNRTNYSNYERYALFGILLGKLFDQTKMYPFLNALLKVNDILLCNTKEMSGYVTSLCYYSMEQENSIINSIIAEKNIK